MENVEPMIESETTKTWKFTKRKVMRRQLIQHKTNAKRLLFFILALNFICLKQHANNDK